MKRDFIKMEGLGNKFVVFKSPLNLTSQEVIEACKEFGSERADGVLVVTPIDRTSVGMKYWNADGSVAEMCGNGLRCVTKFAVDSGMVSPGELSVLTDVGILKVKWDGKDSNNIEVQVGKVVIDPEPVALYDETFYKGNVGNPHAITFVNGVKSASVQTLGPRVENDKLFPSRTNVEFVEIEDKNTINIRTWERGVGETLACGTGMVAAANAAVDVKDAEFPMTVKVLGGQAKVWLDDEGYSRMIGPATVIS